MDDDKLSNTLSVISDTLFRFAGAVALLACAIQFLKSVL